MRRLLRDIAEGRALGDTTTLADPAVVARSRRSTRSRRGSGVGSKQIAYYGGHFRNDRPAPDEQDRTELELTEEAYAGG